jgi:hypothetical protein
MQRSGRPAEQRFLASPIETGLYALGERTMNGSKTPVANHLVRRTQFEASEKERRVALLRAMISDFDNMISDLDEQIADEENHTKIKDAGHPAYSTLAKAAAKRRQNLLTSVAHMKSLLEVASRELDEVVMQFRDLESIQNREPAPAPPSSTPKTISAAR